jgi:xanthine dehydrogenase accessory factor
VHLVVFAMSDFKPLFEQALAWIGQGHGVALATVAKAWGSAPRAPGSHLIIRDDGRFEGSVSGGCVEGDVIAQSSDVLADQKPRLCNYGVTNAQAWEVGLACGGQLDVLLQPISAAGFPPELVTLCLAETAAGRSVTVANPLDGGVAQVASAEAPGAFLNSYHPPLRVAIVGAVHISQALAPMAELLGYEVLVIDPRMAFAAPERFAGFTLSHAWPDEALAAWKPNGRSAIVTLTHDPKLDDPALEAALASDCFYVAALGSRKTHAARLERLSAKGFSAAALARIHGPAGLNIGAETPAEIAASVLAQMTAALRKATP